jgi:hypothetical protein
VIGCLWHASDYPMNATVQSRSSPRTLISTVSPSSRPISALPSGDAGVTTVTNPSPSGIVSSIPAPTGARKMVRPVCPSSISTMLPRPTQAPESPGRKCSMRARSSRAASALRPCAWARFENSIAVRESSRFSLGVAPSPPARAARFAACHGCERRAV